MSYGGSNPPWQRNLTANAGQQNAIANLQSQMINTNLVGFQNFGQNLAMTPQTQQSNLALIPPLGANINTLNNTPFNTIQYPLACTTSVDKTVFEDVSKYLRKCQPNQVQGTQQMIQQQQLHHHQAQQQHQQAQQQQQQQSNLGNQANQTAQVCSKIGLVTKIQNSFGFVDDEIIFHKNVCKGAIPPKIGDRVLVEATFCNNSAFKWNATLVQQVPTQNINQNLNTRSNGNQPQQIQQSVQMQNEQSQASRNYSGFNAATSTNSFVGNYDRTNSQMRSSNHTSSRQVSPPRRSSPERSSRRDTGRDDADEIRRRREKERERERERFVPQSIILLIID